MLESLVSLSLSLLSLSQTRDPSQRWISNVGEPGNSKTGFRWSCSVEDWDVQASALCFMQNAVHVYNSTVCPEVGCFDSSTPNRTGIHEQCFFSFASSLHKVKDELSHISGITLRVTDIYRADFWQPLCHNIDAAVCFYWLTTSSWSQQMRGPCAIENILLLDSGEQLCSSPWFPSENQLLIVFSLKWCQRESCLFLPLVQLEITKILPTAWNPLETLKPSLCLNPLLSQTLLLFHIQSICVHNFSFSVR